MGQTGVMSPTRMASREPEGGRVSQTSSIVRSVAPALIAKHVRMGFGGFVVRGSGRQTSVREFAIPAVKIKPDWVSNITSDDLAALLLPCCCLTSHALPLVQANTTIGRPSSNVTCLPWKYYAKSDVKNDKCTCTRGSTQRRALSSCYAWRRE